MSAFDQLQGEISWMFLCGGDSAISLKSQNLYISGQSEIQIPILLQVSQDQGVYR